MTTSPISLINLLIAALWTVSAIVDYSDFCYLWQLKEYRWDRIRDFFSTRQGKTYWLRYQLLWRSVISIVIFFWPINQLLYLKYALVAIFAIDALHGAYRFWKCKLRHPKLTPKAILIVLLSLNVEGWLFVWARDWSMLLFLVITRFFIMTGVIITLSLPTKLIKKYLIAKATKKISRYDKLTVIGITGSYGKTSVKEFLAHILETKYRVIKTPKNTNTEIGVAQFILNHSFDDKDIFIAEMGAYRMGEIKLICDIVKPTIGILTAINEQHLSLFGDIHKTQQAKYELLRSLPADGLAITNSDNVYCREWLAELPCKFMTFGYDEEHRPTCLITEATNTPSGVHCVEQIDHDEIEIDAPILGDYHCTNIAPCLLVAQFFGLTLSEIQGQSKTLPQTTLKTHQYGSCTVIDDSYNSNPDGFRSALSVLNTYPSERRRVVITRGMLELGEKSNDLHEQLGGEIAFCADELALLTKDFEAPLRRGIGTKYRTQIVVKDVPEDLLSYVRTLKGTNAVILLENRIPGVVHNELIKQT